MISHPQSLMSMKKKVIWNQYMPPNLGKLREKCEELQNGSFRMFSVMEMDSQWGSVEINSWWGSVEVDSWWGSLFLFSFLFFWLIDSKKWVGISTSYRISRILETFLSSLEAAQFSLSMSNSGLCTSLSHIRKTSSYDPGYNWWTKS